MSTLRKNRRSVSRWITAAAVVAMAGTMSWWAQQDATATAATENGPAAAEDRVAFTLPAATGTALRITNECGDIYVEGWDGPEVRVEAVKRAVMYPVPHRHLFKPVAASVDGPALAQDALRHVDIAVNEAGGVLALASEFTAPTTDTQITVDYAVQVPKDVAVFARTNRGDIVVDGLTAHVNAASSAGRVDIRDVRGDVNAETSSGGIAIQCNTPLSSLRQITCRTLDGPITIALPEHSGFGLELQSVGCRFQTGFPMIITAADDMASGFEGRVGEGGPQVAIDTLDGAVSITALEQAP